MGYLFLYVLGIPILLHWLINFLFPASFLFIWLSWILALILGDILKAIVKPKDKKND